MWDEETVHTLFQAMDANLRTQGSQIAFLQLRVSAEAFIVAQCGWALHRATREPGFASHHLRFEKKLPLGTTAGKADLILAPLTSDGREDFAEALILEFKMAWPGGINENASGIRHDLEKLAGTKHAFAVVFAFAFRQASSWAPFGWANRPPESYESFMRTLSLKVGREPYWLGEPLPLETEEAAGTGRLVVWKPLA